MKRSERRIKRSENKKRESGQAKTGMDRVLRKRRRSPQGLVEKKKKENQ